MLTLGRRATRSPHAPRLHTVSSRAARSFRSNTAVEKPMELPVESKKIHRTNVMSLVARKTVSPKRLKYELSTKKNSKSKANAFSILPEAEPNLSEKKPVEAAPSADQCVRPLSEDDLSEASVAAILTDETQIVQAAELFHQCQVPNTARALCEQTLVKYADDNNTNISATTLSQTLTCTLRTLAKANDLASAFTLLDKAEECGFHIDLSPYVALVTSMRACTLYKVKPKGVVVKSGHKRNRKAFCYTSDDFVAVLDDMEKRGVSLTRNVVANVCIPLAGGDQAHRKRLLQAYAAATKSSSSATIETFKIPTIVYTVLLQVAVQENDIDALNEIYNDAISSLPTTDGSRKQRVPYAWETVMISHLADAGLVDQATVRLQNMLHTCGAVSHDAIVKVLRAHYNAANMPAPYHYSRQDAKELFPFRRKKSEDKNRTTPLD